MALVTLILLSKHLYTISKLSIKVKSRVYTVYLKETGDILATDV